MGCARLRTTTATHNTHLSCSGIQCACGVLRHGCAKAGRRAHGPKRRHRAAGGAPSSAWSNAVVSRFRRCRRLTRVFCEQTGDDRAGFALNGAKMTLAHEAFGVDFVDVLGTRWARGEPAVVGRKLDASERFAVSGRLSEHVFYCVAGKAFHSNVCRTGARQGLSLTSRCRPIDVRSEE